MSVMCIQNVSDRRILQTYYSCIFYGGQAEETSCRLNLRYYYD